MDFEREYYPDGSEVRYYPSGKRLEWDVIEAWRILGVLGDVLGSRAWRLVRALVWIRRACRGCVR